MLEPLSLLSLSREREEVCERERGRYHKKWDVNM